MDNQTNEVFGKLLFLNPNTYIAGGYVRDQILGHDSRDVDFIATGVDYWDLLDDCEDLFEWAIPMGHKHGTLVFKDNGIEYEVTVCESIEQKIYERSDFTVNAVAIDSDDNVIAHKNFWSDVQDGVIREAYKGAVEADKIRFLRAHRLAQKLGFFFAEDYDISNEELLTEISKYRRWNEIKKSLKSSWLWIVLLEKYIPKSSIIDFITDIDINTNAKPLRVVPKDRLLEVKELFGCTNKDWKDLLETFA
jgi:tRNA nucleotidyltransferase/poly(A) polymerase